ncbi:MAG TPA: GNAT family N-acetyltransferase, partial [Aeromicrobium sp.]|nr:GNAT family N-acetyltransferase [Aeromicrobium sp.]
AVDWALTEGGAEIVHWKAHVGNEASLRVAHRAGFTLHAPLPGALLEKGRAIDAWTASIRLGDVPLPRTRWAESVVLEGHNVRLRPFRDEDVSRIVEACSDPVTQQWLSGMPRHYTQATAEGYLADCTWHAALGAKATWAVADRHTDLLLGNLSIMDMQGLSPDSGEIGYWMHPDSRGRGVMKEAVMLAVDHAFDPDGLDRRRLSLYAASQNAASNAIARAAGFRHVGTQRQAERLGDDTIDDLQEYELLRRS